MNQINVERWPIQLFAAVSIFAATNNLPSLAKSPLLIGARVGQIHPDFMLPKVDGSMGRLSDYRGKKVLIMHFASW